MFRPSWFPEYSPSEQLVFDEVQKIIQSVYSQYGFAHIQTPAIEANSVLLSKNGEETWKQIFWLYWLAQGNTDTKEYSLHFDLTVPFARYILDRENEITFPFKRFQIQPVWRGERAQRGRFRELRQADVDVIRQEGEKWLIWKNLYYDAETLIVIAHTLQQIVNKFLWEKPFTLHVNNRYLLAGFFSQFDQEKVAALYNLFDKFYKMPFETFQKEIEEIMSKANSEKIINFVKSTFDKLDPNLVDNETYRKGYQELQDVLKYVNILNKNNKYKIIWDPCIIRWLDYYTGTVYETFFDDDISLWSISSGWRYENLTWYINPKKNNYSWVWWSIWLSRMVYLILEQIKPANKTQIKYLFVNFATTNDQTLKLMNDFLEQWEIVEYYPSADKLGKQFAYADKKWIPNVVILWEWEKEKWIYKIKNMLTWEEKEMNL